MFVVGSKTAAIIKHYFFCYLHLATGKKSDCVLPRPFPYPYTPRTTSLLGTRKTCSFVVGQINKNIFVYMQTCVHVYV